MVASRALLESTPMGKCQVGGLSHNRCKRSCPCHNVENGIAALQVSRCVTNFLLLRRSNVSYWVASTEHYLEMTSPRRIVSAHVGRRSLRSSNSNSRTCSNNNNSSSSSSSSNNLSRNHPLRHNSLNKHRSHHSSSKPNNLRWHPWVRFHRVPSMGLYGGLCP